MSWLSGVRSKTGCHCCSGALGNTAEASEAWKGKLTASKNASFAFWGQCFTRLGRSGPVVKNRNFETGFVHVDFLVRAHGQLPKDASLSVERFQAIGRDLK